MQHLFACIDFFRKEYKTVVILYHYPSISDILKFLNKSAIIRLGLLLFYIDISTDYDFLINIL